MEHLTKLQIFGFLVFVIGFLFGVFHLVVNNRKYAKLFHILSFLMVVGLAIVIISAIFTAPANHAGVGFLNRKVPVEIYIDCVVEFNKNFHYT